MVAHHRELEIDVSSVRSPRDLHALLGAMLGFPTWHGHNWDAFWDCASDPQLSSLPETLRVKGMASLAATLPREAGLLEQSLSDLAAEHPGFHVAWV
jgi:RNAse (barnase) inhibitor barstar